MLPIFGFSQKRETHEVFFGMRSSLLSAESKKKLDQLLSCKFINNNEYVVIYGFADNAGTRKEKELLIDNRTKTVSSYLEKRGINKEHILLNSGLGMVDSLSVIPEDTANFSVFRKIAITTEPLNKKKNAVVPLAKFTICDVKSLIETSKWDTSQLDSSKTTTITTTKNDKVELPNGDEFIGKLNSERKKIDYGTYLYASGDKYVGNFKNDIKEGYGKVIWRTGESFEGIWKNDVPVKGKFIAVKPIRNVLRISCNQYGRLFIEEEDMGLIKEGETKKIYVPAGELNIKIKSVFDDDEVVTNFKGNNYNNVILLDLKTLSNKKFIRKAVFKGTTTISKPIIKKPNINIVQDTDMIGLGGGLFIMGNDISEVKAHPVWIDSFYICNHDVTVAEFRKFIVATGYKTTAEKQGVSWVNDQKKNNNVKGNKYIAKMDNVTWACDANGLKRKTSDDNMPVLHISWFDAEKYCEWLRDSTHINYRLPTEAEWEFASRGGKWKYQLVDSTHQIYLITDGKSGNTSTKSSNYLCNEVGMKDLFNNTWEWCNDWYSSISYSYTPDSTINPKGAFSGSMKVQRGGTWNWNQSDKIFSSRYFNYPYTHGAYITFRVARSY